MADPTLADAITLLTKVSGDTVQRLKSLEKEVRASISGSQKSSTSRGSTAPREAPLPREIVEKPDAVVVTDFGPAAEDDLAAAFGRETERVLEKQQEKNNSDFGTILKLLGVGAAVAALANGEGIIGLVAGLQRVYKKIDKFASRASKVLGQMGKSITRFATTIGRSAKTIFSNARKAMSKAVSSMGKQARRLVSKLGSKLTSVASGIKNGISKAITKVTGVTSSISTKFGGAFKAIGSKITSWGSALKSGMQKAVKAAAAAAQAITGKAAGFFEKAAKFASDKVSSAKKAVGGAVQTTVKKAASVGKAVGGAVSSGASKVGRAVGAKAIDIAKGALKAAAKSGGGIMKLLRVAGKSPVLAPVLESIFVKKDVNELQDMYANGEIDREQLAEAVGKRGLEAVGGVVGGLGGAALGALLGPLGAIGGGIAGDIGGRWIANNVIAPMMGDNVEKVGNWALDSWMFRNYVPKERKGEVDLLAQIDDGIIFSQDGRVLAQANPSDTIYAMKEGGPLLTTLASASKVMVKY